VLAALLDTFARLPLEDRVRLTAAYLRERPRGAAAGANNPSAAVEGPAA
jgi:hypothetical protein